MENNFDLQKLWGTTNRDGDNLQIGAYAGNASLAVFKKGINKPVVKLSLNLSFIRELKRLAKEATTANPGTRLPFIQLVYDADTKSYKTGINVTFIKDDKRLLSIEVSTPTTAPMTFRMRGRGTFSNGDDSLSEERKSVLGLQEFYDVLDKMIYTAMELTRWNLTKLPSRTGNTGPNKQHLTSEGYRKQSNSADPFKGGDDDLDNLL